MTLTTTEPFDALRSGRRTLEIEAAAVAALGPRLDERFGQAVAVLLACTGRVVVSGIGKSGHIARKVAATLASTGTPAFFVHPAEASHGDLGMIASDDVLLAFSNSGETQELLTLVPFIKRRAAKVICVTGNAKSQLALAADVHLDAAVDKEACPLNLAPTASTAAQLALGDALAVACLEARGFGPEEFASAHPGGALGRRLLTHVRDVMRTGERIPAVRDDVTVMQAVQEISKKLMGMTAVVDAAGKLAGIFTDGDLRHLIERIGDVRALHVREAMTRHPITIGPDALAVEAAALLERVKRNQLLVVDHEGLLIGALHTQDLMTAQVI